MTDAAPLILASASPRRRELLGLLGIAFDVIAANVDEAVHPGERPEAYVVRVAEAKAAAIASRHPGRRVLAADTSVIVDGEILGKPATDAEALEMLARLSGRTHLVLTAMALAGNAQTVSTHVVTEVTFRPTSAAEREWYVSTGEPRDKAGAYGLQGAGGVFVSRIDGSPSNVVGLPLAECAALLAGGGVRLPWSPACPSR